METRNIRVLIQECSARLNAAGYSASRISWHERKWENGICRFLSKLGTEEYSRDLGEQYLQGVIQGVPYNTAKSLKRNINILTEYLEHGTISSRIHDFTLYISVFPAAYSLSGDHCPLCHLVLCQMIVFPETRTEAIETVFKDNTFISLDTKSLCCFQVTVWIRLATFKIL